MKNENSNFELPPSLTPPKIMDCKDWHDTLQEFKEEEIKKLDPNDPFLPELKKVTFCKDNCTVCLTGTQKGAIPHLETCAGTEQLDQIKMLPDKECKRYDMVGMFETFCNLTGLKHESDQQSNTGILSRNPEKHGEICKCEIDLCNLKRTTGASTKDNNDSTKSSQKETEITKNPPDISSISPESNKTNSNVEITSKSSEEDNPSTNSQRSSTTMTTKNRKFYLFTKPYHITKK